MPLSPNSNFSMLPWLPHVKYQQHRKPEAQGKVWPLIAGVKKLPPFQIYRPHPELAHPITFFQVYEISVNSKGITTILNTYDILAEATTAGLTIREFPDDGYDLITWPGDTALATLLPNEGTYYASISDAVDGEGNTWYSEAFCIKSDLSKYLKISFWHDVGLSVPGHHISYATPFKNFIYLETTVNKPEYSNRPDVNDVDGFPYVMYQVSVKTFRFNVLLPEYAMDLIRLLSHHYYIVIEENGLTYEVIWIDGIQGEWLPQGNLCPWEFKFLTDTIVATTGKLKPEGEGFAYDQTAYQEGHS
jgi:hypothetical protein